MTGEGSPAPRVDETVLARLVADLGPEHVVEVCNLFVDDGRERVRSIRSACEAGDADAVARSAHRLKSASGFVGACRVTAMCREIEVLVGDGRLEDACSRAEQVGDELEVASGVLAALVRSAGGPAGVA